jgi:hypothetical protein
MQISEAISGFLNLCSNFYMKLARSGRIAILEQPLQFVKFFKHLTVQNYYKSVSNFQKKKHPKSLSEDLCCLEIASCVELCSLGNKNQASNLCNS